MSTCFLSLQVNIFPDLTLWPVGTYIILLSYSLAEAWLLSSRSCKPHGLASGFQARPAYRYWEQLHETYSSTVMVLSQFMQTINPFNETLGLVKAASIGLVVALLIKIIKSLTTPSPYQHIPGPKPSNSTLGILDLIPNNNARWYISDKL